MAETPEQGLQIGSYGRVGVGSTPGGAGGTPAVVAIPTRIVKAPYLELDLVWSSTDPESGARFDAVVTPALTGALFHYDGAFDGDLTLRNLYASARDAVGEGSEVWAGSRMVRGDDVYLLDAWVLDNLNIVGGGGGWSSDTTRVRVAGGLNRIEGSAWQLQQVERPVAGGVGTESVTVLDRQRAIGALTVDRVVTFGDGLALRPRLHGELHGLPAGARLVEDGTVSQPLPADHGLLAGAELSLWGWAPDSYAHLFVRHAGGLAATGWLHVPGDGYAPDRTVTDAREDVLGLAGNHETDTVSVAVGLIARRWHDADGQEIDEDDGSDLSLAVRPAWKAGAHGNVAVELAHERGWRNGVNPRSGTQALATVTRVSLLPALQLRQGTFGRPQVRLQYTASLLNDGARERYDALDVRRRAGVSHWVGIGAEWWINSWSYR
jgi:maltoporin